MNILYFSENKIHECLYIGGKVYSTSMCAIQANKVGLKPTALLHVNNPPQTQGGCETNLTLSIKARRHLLRCDLVKISAS